MNTPPYRFLFYITLSYSYSILRPIAAELKARGHEFAWYVRPGSEAEQFIRPDDAKLSSVDDVMAFNADALLAPGNNIPAFFPGIKVQVFHGFDSGKKNKFRIRGYFDLYCTQGPMTTRGFIEQRQSNPSFDIVETGWPKLDALFTPQPETLRYTSNAKTILYAPTFSPKLTSTYALYDEIKRLSQSQPWQWLVKFHPKATQKEVDMYRNLTSERLRVVATDDLIPLLQAADVLLSDTSSILSEFSLQNKPCISFNNRRPANWMINFTAAAELEAKIHAALAPSPEQIQLLQAHSQEIHPYRDGQSSARVVDAVEAMIQQGTAHLAKKPSNWFRNLKMRKKLGYYRL